MDDQPKEGAEGDKKIVHTYALVKVMNEVVQIKLCMKTTICQSNNQSIFRFASYVFTFQ
jgi:hypothetical protein